MNFRIFILIFIFSISCDSPKSNYTPKSSGNINTLTVVMENSIWESSVGDVVRESFASEFLGLPQQEPIFSLKQMPFEAFSGFTRESRNILLIKKSNKVNFALEKDKYARPQSIAIITGPSNEVIEEKIKLNKEKIISEIKKTEIKEKQRRIKISRMEENDLSSLLSIDLVMPSAYKIFKKGTDKIVWIQRETDKGTVNILAYELSESSFLKTNTLKSIIKLRDSIGKVFIPGRNKGSYMLTEEAYEPYVKKTKVGGKEAVETRGTWELKNDFMAGPFLNYIIKDKENKRTLVLEGFVFSPSTKKRDLIFELEAVFRSLKIYKKKDN